MRGNGRGHVSTPPAKKNGGLAVIALREPHPAILLRHFYSKRADLGETFEIFRRNFTGAIDLVRVDVFAQITFKFMQEIFASRAVLRALRGKWINSTEIVASDEKIAGETTAVFKRIARRFGQLERFALAFRHLRCVNDGSRRFFRFCAGFLSDLFFGRFEQAFHTSTGVSLVWTPWTVPGVSS